MRAPGATRGALFVAVLALASPARGQDTALEDYVALGLRRSPAIVAGELSIQQARARWSEARRAYLPTLALDARYSVSDGGRSFDIPVGDLLNPVYDALDELRGAPGTSPSFPRVENQRVDFLRSREQETRLRISQLLFNPEVGHDIHRHELQTASSRASLDARKRELVRDIKVAYYRYANAARAVGILESAVELVLENERSTRSLWQASMVTRDHVHRARAERLETQQQREQAEVDRALAASWLNYLVGRPSDAPVDLDQADLALPAHTVEQAMTLVSTRPGGGGEASGGEGRWESQIDALARSAVRSRPELHELETAARAAEAGAAAIRGSTLPSLALSVDAGIQGRDYGFGSEDRFAMASLVFRWEVGHGGAARARARAADLEADRLHVQRDDLARRIRLEVERAARNALVALTNLPHAEERLREAEGAFRLVARRRDEGMATALEFLDARSTLTRARLGQNVTETEALIRLADLEFAAGVPAQHVLPSRTEEEQR